MPRNSILLVEDDPGLRVLLERVLRGAGYDVQAAASAEEGLVIWERAERKLPVALVDLTLPGDIGGRQLGARLKNESPAVQVILTSGELPDFDQWPGWLQAFVFLQKPFLPSDLLRVVHDAFEQAGAGPGATDDRP